MGMMPCILSGYVSNKYRWHADIKPDNILSVQGKFKLCDPGFAKFIDKTDEDPIVHLDGGTETFGNPPCYPPISAHNSRLAYS